MQDACQSLFKVASNSAMDLLSSITGQNKTVIALVDQPQSFKDCLAKERFRIEFKMEMRNSLERIFNAVQARVSAGPTTQFN